MFVPSYFIIRTSAFDFVHCFYVKFLLLIRLVRLLFESIKESTLKVGNLYTVQSGLPHVV